MLAAVALAIAADVSAQPIFDHLECYTIKDPLPHTRYTATLTPEQLHFVTQNGCEVQVPARYFCYDVEMSNVSPPPPEVLNGQNTRDFLCYRLRCGRVLQPLNVEDEFGTRTITLKKSGYLCAPARKVGFPDPPPPLTCNAFPETCKEVQENAEQATGTRPPDGTYTLYVAGDETRPWAAYCHHMNREEPAEYLTVTAAANFSEVSDGAEVTTTQYRRLRIDPIRLMIDPADATFATTTNADANEAIMPGGRDYVPAGWAQYVGQFDDDGPPARAQADLAGTAFALAESVADDFFCTFSGAPPAGDSSGSERQIAGDLRSFTLSAINTAAGVPTKTVADCDNFGGDNVITCNFTVAAWPLQYLGP